MSAAANLKPWQPGQSGNPGGKPKRIFPRVDQLLKEAGLEPIAELVKLLPRLSHKEQAKVWVEILPYVHAKALPLDPNEANDLDKLSTAELIQLVKENLPEVG